jgi:hypothetical protein
MDSLSVIQAIQAIGRPIFTTREIALLVRGSLSSTSHVLSRLERRGLVRSVTRGVWCTPDDPKFSPFLLVPFLSGGHQAYVSFYSALNLHGLMEQIPQSVDVATTGHTHVTTTPVGTYSFHRLHPNFFAGFDWYRGGREFLIATPEKALIDTLYLSSRRGKRFRFFPELQFGRGFSLQEAQKWAARIPYPRIRKYVQEHLKSLWRTQRMTSERNRVRRANRKRSSYSSLRGRV